MRKTKSSHSPVLKKLQDRIIDTAKSGSRDPIGESAAAVATALKALGSLSEGTLMEELVAAVDEPTRNDFVAAFLAIRDIASQAITALGGEKTAPAPSSSAKVLSITSTAYGRLSDKERREFLRRGGTIVSTNHTPRRWGAKV